MRTLMQSAANGSFEPIYLYCCFAAKVCFCSEGCQSPSPVQSRRRGSFKNIHAATLSVFGALSCDVPSQPRPIIKVAVPRHSESPPI